jgi:hypothetical protein
MTHPQASPVAGGSSSGSRLFTCPRYRTRSTVSRTGRQEKPFSAEPRLAAMGSLQRHATAPAPPARTTSTSGLRQTEPTPVHSPQHAVPVLYSSQSMGFSHAFGPGCLSHSSPCLRSICAPTALEPFRFGRRPSGASSSARSVRRLIA